MWPPTIEPKALSNTDPNVFEIILEPSIVPSNISIFDPSNESRELVVTIIPTKSCFWIVPKIFAIPSISESQFVTLL